MWPGRIALTSPWSKKRYLVSAGPLSSGSDGAFIQQHRYYGTTFLQVGKSPRSILDFVISTSSRVRP